MSARYLAEIIREQAASAHRAEEAAQDRECHAEEREQRQGEALERERTLARLERERAAAQLAQQSERASAQLQEIVKLINSREPSVHNSRQTSHLPSRDPSPPTHQPKEEPRSQTPQNCGRNTVDSQDLTRRLARLKEETPRHAPGSSIPVRPVDPLLPPSWPAYYLPHPHVQGPTFPKFTTEDRKQYIELRIVLGLLLNDQHTEEYKYAVLLQHVRVPRAHSMVLAYSGSKTPYTSALKALDGRYGRPWDHIMNTLRTLEKQPPVKDDRALDDFAVEVQSLVGMLEAQGEAGRTEIRCGSNVERLLQRIPSHRRERFRRQQAYLHHGTDHVPTLAEFAEFLMAEVDNIKVAPAPEEPKRGTRDKRDRASWNKGDPTRVMTTIKGDPKKDQKPPKGKKGGSSTKQGDKKSPPPCQCCKEPHWLDKCPVFTKKNTEEKKEWMKEQNKCWRCARDHRAADCTLKKPCKVAGCEKNHLTVLHDVNQRGPKVKSVDVEAGSEAPAETYTYYIGPVRGSNPRVLLKIVRVLLRHNGTTLDTHAVLDDGSERTLLMKEAAVELGLRGTKERMHLHTVQPNPTEIEGECVAFTISPAGRPQEEHRVSHVFTAGKLTLSQYS